jgi:hypothetical protein
LVEIHRQMNLRHVAWDCRHSRSSRFPPRLCPFSPERPHEAFPSSYTSEATSSPTRMLFSTGLRGLPQFLVRHLQSLLTSRSRGHQQSLKAQVQVSVSTDVDEGCQVVGPHRCHARHRVLLPPAKTLSPRYLAVVVGRCLNCLSPSH